MENTELIVKDNEIYAQTLEKLGELWNYKRAYMSQLMKMGAPEKTESGYPVLAWAKWLVNKSKDKKRRADDPMEAARLLYRQEKAKLARIERETIQGKLVDKQQYREAEISRHTEIAQKFRSLPGTVSARVANKSAAEAQAIIDAEVKRILKYFENMLLYGRQKADEAFGLPKAGRPKKIDKAAK